MVFFFFFDNEKKLKDKQIELHYLSNTISYGKEKYVILINNYIR